MTVSSQWVDIYQTVGKITESKVQGYHTQRLYTLNSFKHTATTKQLSKLNSQSKIEYYNLNNVQIV